jgi:hypothetical protein
MITTDLGGDPLVPLELDNLRRCPLLRFEDLLGIEASDEDLVCLDDEGGIWFVRRYESRRIVVLQRGGDFKAVATYIGGEPKFICSRNIDMKGSLVHNRMPPEQCVTTLLHWVHSTRSVRHTEIALAQSGKVRSHTSITEPTSSNCQRPQPLDEPGLRSKKAPGCNQEKAK